MTFISGTFLSKAPANRVSFVMNKRNLTSDIIFITRLHIYTYTHTLAVIISKPASARFPPCIYSGNRHSVLCARFSLAVCIATYSTTES